MINVQIYVLCLVVEYRIKIINKNCARWKNARRQKKLRKKKSVPLMNIRKSFFASRINFYVGDQPVYQWFRGVTSLPAHCWLFSSPSFLFLLSKNTEKLYLIQYYTPETLFLQICTKINCKHIGKKLFTQCITELYVYQLM